MDITEKEKSNLQAQKTWTEKSVGSQRAKAKKGTLEYFEQIQNYRYGYETPFVFRLFELNNLKGKDVLEIGTGQGIDGVAMAIHGANYHGLDITEEHINLTKKHFELRYLNIVEFYEDDLTDLNIDKKFDCIYSFGTLHHIAHEEQYLKKMASLLKPGGTIRIGVYSKYSFFNAYLFAMWVLKNRMKISFNSFQGRITEGSKEDVTIKVRSRREIRKLLNRCGLRIVRYYKRGFVQKYIPFFGKLLLKPDGFTLNFLGSILGWYHIFWLEPEKK